MNLLLARTKSLLVDGWPPGRPTAVPAGVGSIPTAPTSQGGGWDGAASKPTL
jgi:hypothetical protein